MRHTHTTWLLWFEITDLKHDNWAIEGNNVRASWWYDMNPIVCTCTHGTTKHCTKRRDEATVHFTLVFTLAIALFSTCSAIEEHCMYGAIHIKCICVLCWYWCCCYFVLLTGGELFATAKAWCTVTGTDSKQFVYKSSTKQTGGSVYG